MSSVYPCGSCQMSKRNSVHHNKAQFGYHAYVEMYAEEPEPKCVCRKDWPYVSKSCKAKEHQS